MSDIKSYEEFEAISEAKNSTMEDALKAIHDFNENPSQDISVHLTTNVLRALGYDHEDDWKARNIAVKHFEKMLDSDPPPNGYTATLGIMPKRKETIIDLIKKLEKKGIKRLKALSRESVNEGFKLTFKEAVNEAASVPSNILDFAKRKGSYATSLVKKVATWAEKAGKHISGGTAIGKDYSTIILDMKHQGSEIRINLDEETITLFDEEVMDAKSFKRVLDAKIKNESVNESKGAGLSKEETLEVAKKFAEALSIIDGVKVTVNMTTLDEDSFDLDYDGYEFEGGSYNIYDDGAVKNMAVRKQPIVGTKDDDVKTIVKYMKKHYGKLAKESVVTEGFKLTFKDAGITDLMDLKNAMSALKKVGVSWDQWGRAFRFDSKQDREKAKEALELKESLNEGKWTNIMRGVRKAPQPPFSIVAIQGGEVVDQKISISDQNAIPAHYEDIKRKNPGAKISIENGEGLSLYNESLNEARSITKISKDLDKTVNAMKDLAVDYKTAEGKEKDKLFKQLKELTAKKKKLAYELEQVVSDTDKDMELEENESLTEAKKKKLILVPTRIAIMRKMRDILVSNGFEKEYSQRDGGFVYDLDPEDNGKFAQDEIGIALNKGGYDEIEDFKWVVENKSVNEAKTYSASQVDMNGPKILKKLYTDSIFTTDKDEYTVTWPLGQANAFREFEAVNRAGEKKRIKLTAMYGTKFEVGDDVRSARYNRTEKLVSVTESLNLNEADSKYLKKPRARVVDKNTGEVIEDNLPKALALKYAAKKKGWVIEDIDESYIIESYDEFFTEATIHSGNVAIGYYNLDDDTIHGDILPKKVADSIEKEYHDDENIMNFGSFSNIHKWDAHLDKLRRMHTGADERISESTELVNEAKKSEPLFWIATKTFQGGTGKVKRGEIFQSTGKEVTRTYQTDDGPDKFKVIDVELANPGYEYWEELDRVDFEKFFRPLDPAKDSKQLKLLNKWGLVDFGEQYYVGSWYPHRGESSKDTASRMLANLLPTKAESPAMAVKKLENDTGTMIELGRGITVVRKWADMYNIVFTDKTKDITAAKLVGKMKKPVYTRMGKEITLLKESELLSYEVSKLDEGILDAFRKSKVKVKENTPVRLGTPNLPELTELAQKALKTNDVVMFDYDVVGTPLAGIYLVGAGAKHHKVGQRTDLNVDGSKVQQYVCKTNGGLTVTYETHPMDVPSVFCTRKDAQKIWDLYRNGELNQTEKSVNESLVKESEDTYTKQDKYKKGDEVAYQMVFRGGVGKDGMSKGEIKTGKISNRKKNGIFGYEYWVGPTPVKGGEILGLVESTIMLEGDLLSFEAFHEKAEAESNVRRLINEGNFEEGGLYNIYFTTTLNPDTEDAEGWTAPGEDEDEAWDNLFRHFKTKLKRKGNNLRFWNVQIKAAKDKKIEPYTQIQ